MTCEYTFAGPDGREIKLIGKPALKAYLASGGMQFLLPQRAAQVAAFRRTPIQQALSAPTGQAAMVERVATGIASRWANPPAVVVFTDMQDPRIPQEVRDADAKQRAGGARGEPEGFYYRGTAYLSAAQIATPKDAARVLFHEGLGHYGLRGVFGEALRSELEQIVALRKKDVLAKARQYGLDTANPEALLQAAEEVLAVMAQTKPDIGFVRRALAAIRTWLRQNVPGMAGIELSDAEIIRDYILPARAFVELGAKAGRDLAAGSVAFQRAYHGTPYRGITTFDTDKIGTGEGNTAYGWGLYFASKREIAEHYRKTLQGGPLGGKVMEAAQRALGVEYDEAASSTEFIEGVRKVAGQGEDAVRAAIIKTADRMAKSQWPGEQRRAPMVRALADNPAVVKAVNQEAAGQLYEVEIPEDSEMLLWDKPLSQQPEGVRKAIKGLMQSNVWDADTRKLVGDTDIAGKKFYEALAGVDAFAGKGPFGKAASEALLALGIKGIKYLDGGSRAAGDGSYNYVVFSGDDVAIQRAMFSRASAVTSDAFRRWFGDSKVVDADGKPMVMYHGTARGGFTIFDRNKSTEWRQPSMDTVGSWFSNNPSDDTGAGLYARAGGNGDTIYPVYLSIKNPKKYRTFNDFLRHMHRAAGRPMPENAPGRGSTEELRNELMAEGYDGIEFEQTANESLMQDIQEMQDAVERAKQDEFSVRRADRLPYTQKRERLEQTLRSMRKELDEFGSSTEFDGQRVFVAFEPEQIKSATGNRGTFDPANPDIRFSRSEPPGLTPPDQGLLRRVQASIQDSMNRVRQVQDRIQGITGQPLPEQSDYYGAETNRPGRIAARLEDAQRQLVAPLMRKLAKSGHTQEQLSELLHAMHAKERNEAIAKINPDMPDGGSGMTTDKAAKILAKYRGDATMQALANEARAIAARTLDLKLAYGLIDRETVSTLRDRYEFYVPLKGDGEYGPKIKRAMGHDEREEHILENIARDYEMAVVAGEKNLARQSLLQMVLENPDPDLWTVGVPPKGRRIVKENGYHVVFLDGQRLAQFKTEDEALQWGEMYAAMNGEPPDIYGTEKFSRERVQSYIKPLQDNEVMVYVDGNPVRIQIADETLASQLRPLDRGRMNPILEFMRSTNRYLSKIYTGYNPAFIIRNTARDAMTGSINIIGNEGLGTLARAWSNYPAAMKALSIYAATGKVPDGEGGKMLQEYREHGGKTGASWMSDLEQQGKTLQRLYDDAYGASGYLRDRRPGKAAVIAGRKIVGGMAHAIEVMNQATENGLRLALYTAMRKQGVSPGEAARAAKSVTVDFDRRGTMSPALGAIYLFFNPAVQGTANAMKTLFKGKNKEQAWMALGALAALGFYLASAGLDDDEDRWLGEDWDSRARNMIVSIGGARLKVPVSMEFAPAYAMGVALAEASRGAVSKMKAAGHMVSSFIDAYFPLQGFFSSESDNHGMDAAMATVPTMLKPGVQIAANRNSFGTQVVPDNEMTKDRPDNLKMFKGTKGTVYDAAAQGIASAGEAMGAGRYENDISKVSPETLKMLWRTYTGGLGAFITDLGGLANVGAQAPGTVDVADVPIVKDFVKANDAKAIRGRFYDLSKEARRAATEFQQAKKAGDDEAMDKIMSRPEKAEMLGLDRLIRNTVSAATAIRDEMVDVNADKAMSLAEKRAKLKELEKAEEEIYRGAIGAFR